MSESIVPKAVFAPVSRTGIVAGLSGPQLVLLIIGLLRPMWSLTVGKDLPGALSQFALWTVPVSVLAVGSWRGRSFLERVCTVGLYWLRRAGGQTRTVVKVTDPRAVDGRITIPGAAGERMWALDLVGTPYAGAAFVWDAVEQTATVVLRFTTEGWGLADDTTKATRARGLSNMCQSMASVAGIKRVVLHARTYTSSPAMLPGPTLDPRTQAGAFAADDYAELTEFEHLANPRARDTLVAITVARKDVAAEVDDAGGGLAGMSWVLGDRVRQVVAKLPDAGVRQQDAAWLTAGQIRASVRLAFDPAAAVMLADSEWSLPAEALLATVADERLDHVVTDSGVHRTYWVERWPATPAQAGFLERLVASGTYLRTVTMMWSAMPVHSAEKRQINAEASHNSAASTNTKLGRPNSVRHDAETKELKKRRGELEAGYTDVRFSGWVTLTAASTDELRTGEVWLKSVTPGLSLKCTRGDQWAGFCTAALPLGLGARS